jgi:ferredoxin
MTYVTTTPCVDCKYTDCAAVCPVEAFHETPDRLLINPDTCIDCDACLPECPVEAIFSDMSIPEEYQDWLEKNAEAQNFPIISTKVPALMGAGCSGPPEA